MWDLDDEMQAFKALSYRDKLRVSRCLAKGRAPDDQQMGVAAVELAESYQRKSRAQVAILRWAPVVIVGVGVLGVALNAIDGVKVGLIVYALMILVGITNFVFNPLTRPQNMARSLKASRLIASAGVAPYLPNGADYVEDIRRADAERLSQFGP